MNHDKKSLLTYLSGLKKKLTIAGTYEDAEILDFSHLAGGDVNARATMENRCVVVYKVKYEPEIPFLGFYVKNKKNICLRKHLGINVYGGYIQNYPEFQLVNG